MANQYNIRVVAMNAAGDTFMLKQLGKEVEWVRVLLPSLAYAGYRLAQVHPDLDKEFTLLFFECEGEGGPILEVPD